MSQILNYLVKSLLRKGIRPSVAAGSIRLVATNGTLSPELVTAVRVPLAPAVQVSVGLWLLMALDRFQRSRNRETVRTRTIQYRSILLRGQVI